MTTSLRFAGYRTYSTLGASDPTARPYLPVRLQQGGRHVDTIALVDSGADFSFFNYDLSRQLGISFDPGDMRTASGIGSAEYWIARVRLIVAGRSFDADVAFAPRFNPGFGLLGQGDFFRQFRVAFEGATGSLYYHGLP